ncbi:MAG: hypothetical protein HYV93_22715 [Candidatus Rokubacteria bacterium]|nr:hypothetical protein [Candidatus Rokubacteria bacterium]
MLRTPLGRKIAMLVVPIAIGSAVPAPGWADVTRHSGTVLAVDRDAGTLVLGEVGPWRVTDGVTEVTRLTIALRPSTEVVIVARSAGAGPTGWVGEFAETPLGEAELGQGKFVTVTVQREGGRLVAQKVSVVAPEP